LRRELERRAEATKRGKNWIVKEALEHYLLGSSHDRLREEARRQSLRVRATAVDAAWVDRVEAMDDWKA
jgi:predicted transcriptional regulator